MAVFTGSPLSPTLFLDRAAAMFAQRTAIIDGDRKFTYGEFAERAHRLAGLVRDIGIEPGDRVAALCVNSHMMLEMHNGVAMTGAALVPINIRLSAGEIAYILQHSGARVLFATEELADCGHEAARSSGTR